MTTCLLPETIPQNQDKCKIICRGDHSFIYFYDRYGNINNYRSAIDNEDVGRVKKYKWHISIFNGSPYVSASVGGTSLYLTHLIMKFKATPLTVIDHIDGNTLNNRKSNLRVATRAQNLWNRGPAKNNKSGYKGVSWDKEKRKWTSRIMANGRQKQIGRFDDKKEAALAYNLWAKKLHGDFAWLNEV